LYSDPSHPLVQKYLNIAKKTYPGVSLTKYHSACDGRFFSKDGNVVLLHRPSFANAH
jgi:acetylornithine deacetylase/succinyl-diaminopimelate desuccinylase-like protein